MQRRQALESAHVQQPIDFGFASYWLRKWRDIRGTLLLKSRNSQLNLKLVKKRGKGLKKLKKV